MKVNEIQHNNKFHRLLVLYVRAWENRQSVISINLFSTWGYFVFEAYYAEEPLGSVASAFRTLFDLTMKVHKLWELLKNHTISSTIYKIEQKTKQIINNLLIII